MFAYPSLRFMRSTFVGLLCFVAMLLSGAAPATAQTVDPRWGVFAQLAEHDFAYSHAIFNWRWKIPGRVLSNTTWSLGGHTVVEYELDGSTGEIEARHFYQTRRDDFETSRGFKVTADGSITKDGKPYISAAPSGYRTFGKNVVRLITPSDKAATSVAKLINSGRIRAANPQLGINAQASAELPATISIAQPQVPPMPIFTIAQGQGPRFALIIGNSAYSSWMGELPNPANDAEAMARTLRGLGFNVSLVKNADQKVMKRAIADFGERLAAAGKNATGLFFYAGHGLQVKGINYLVPIDAEIRSQGDVDLEGVAADTILSQMEEAGSSTNIVILDACRNMPLVRGMRSASRGLAPMDAPNGSFIAYSTAPGSVAADGAGANSPFVTALIRNIGRKGEPIESIFRDVRRSVLTETEGAQTPWDSSSLIQPFYFAGQ